MRKIVWMLALVISGTAFAAPKTIADYKAAEAKQGDEWATFKVLITGMGQGYQIANALMTKDFGVGYYCATNRVEFDADNYIQMMDAFLIKHPKLHDDMLLSLVLAITLNETFPCKK